MFGKRLSEYLGFQKVFLGLVAVVGLARRGLFAAPEYSGPFAHNQWAHVLGHVTLGVIIPSLVLWGAASVVMLITKKVARRPAVA